ncbi:lactonase family protein [Prevotella sp. 10(H)]|uniref:lactonase family protein n=1 Tax=Prevotella sp. 10(H) TaxID=1158294 RepID=UPI00068EE2C7|nr:lactonase family protein [Prevotella sp. 10(H)]
MKSNIHLLAGTYVLGENNGIHIYRFDQDSGESELIGKGEVDCPTYIVPSKNGKYIYSVLENEEMPSYVNAFSYKKQKEELEQIDSILSGDDGSCYITIDKDDKHIITANYGGGSISVFDIDTNGQFYKMSQLIVFEGKSVNPERQTKSHIHCVEFSPDGRYLFASDLGADMLYQMEIDYECKECQQDFVINKTIKSIKVPDGSGPRHIVFHPSGKYLYLINELSDTIIAFSYDDGEVAQIQEIPVVTNKAGGSADIVITPDGKYLYASVRLKDDGIAVFAIDPSNGILEKTGYQSTATHPRNLRITPNGKYLLSACKEDSVIEIYKLNESDGSLENIDKDINIVEPACLKFI